MNPIGQLIDERMQALGLTATMLALRLGYKNIAKGVRRIEALRAGQFDRLEPLIKILHPALEVPATAIHTALLATQAEEKALRASEAKRAEAAWRAAFRPHAVILPERSVPSPIFIVAFMGGPDRLLKINLDAMRGPETFAAQTLAALPETIICFGKPVGFVVNYTPDLAVRFDLLGHEVEVLSQAVRTATATLSLSGRPISSGDLTAMMRARTARSG